MVNYMRRRFFISGNFVGHGAGTKDTLNFSARKGTFEMTKKQRLRGIGFRRTVMLLCMMFLLLPAALCGAEKKARKVVRVAYLSFNRLMIVDDNNKPVSGYAYEYIRKPACCYRPRSSAG